MAFGGPRSSCVHPGAHSARHQDSHKDWTPCRMAWPFVSAGAHAPHSDERLGPTATQGASHSAHRLRPLAFLCSSVERGLEEFKARRRDRLLRSIPRKAKRLGLTLILTLNYRQLCAFPATTTTPNATFACPSSGRKSPVVSAPIPAPKTLPSSVPTSQLSVNNPTICSTRSS